MSAYGAPVLSCIDTVKRRERNESYKKRCRAEEDSSMNSVVLRSSSSVCNSSRSKSTLYQIEIVEECEQQVKVHYTGYSKHYDEWIRRSQIGYKPVLLPSRPIESLELQNMSMLACSIKRKLVPGKREDPKVRIQVPFDTSSMELLKQQAVPLTLNNHRGHQGYGIKAYKDLDELLGEQWHLRVANINGDFSYAVLKTIQFHAFHPKPLLDFTPSVCTHQDDPELSLTPFYTEQQLELSFNFVRMDGNRRDLINSLS